VCYGYATMAFISNMYDDNILVGGGGCFSARFCMGTSPYKVYRSDVNYRVHSFTKLGTFGTSNIPLLSFFLLPLSTFEHPRSVGKYDTPLRGSFMYTYFCAVLLCCDVRQCAVCCAGCVPPPRPILHAHCAMHCALLLGA
jgi:hypothetical protein